MLSLATTSLLIVDDTPDIRMLLRLVFESEGGFDVLAEAADGAAAIELARIHQPDVVLLDLAMPVMDGLEALPRLRRAAPRAAIIVLSGFSRSAIVDEAISLGADAYVQKGAGPGTIVNEVLAAVARRTQAETGDVTGPLASPTPPASPESPLTAEALSSIVHELQNPIAAIGGLTRTLDRSWNALADAQRRELMGGVIRQTRRLEVLVRDLLSSAQVAGGQLRVDLQPLSVASCIASGIANLPPDAPTFTVDCPRELTVLADPVRVDQVLTNYLTNALKYGAPPYRITAVPQGTTIRIEVHDSGPGVPPDLVPHLFERYRRADGTGQPGTGLGLFVVQAVARAQGGDAWYSPGVPSGSSFNVVLRAPEPG